MMIRDLPEGFPAKQLFGNGFNIYFTMNTL